MRTFCVVGKSGAGKTTLVEQLVKALTSKGYSVCTVKHTHLRNFDLKGKDTMRHLASGASIAAGLAEDETVVLMGKKDIEYIKKLASPIDFLIIEGGKGLVCPKILVGDIDATGENYIAKWRLGEPVEPVLEAIFRLPADSVQLYVDGKRINIKPYIQKAIISMLIGFISTLKGIESMDRELVVKVNLREFKEKEKVEDLL
ncbi:MAG: molybdopterin-guanine dinucleotide biosynthesis protein B [Nitrososphaeria archaeon]|nr:molybdopterin-guanine dinucleotide biosynthesis protein B [Nitrososphaeria archaeon]